MYNKVIVIGPYLYHKDSYINFGFQNAFLEKNIETYWIHNKNINDLNKINNQKNILYIINTLNKDIINNIPLFNENYYVIIKCPTNKFEKMNSLKIIEYSSDLDVSNFKKIDDYIYKSEKKIIMPFGTILTPSQIIENLEDFIEIKDRNENIIFTGQYDNINHKNLIDINCNRTIIKKLISLENEIELIRKTLLSCCFSSDKSKIDIKTLTHISYGTQILTNSKIIKDFLDNKCEYINDMKEYNYCKLIKKTKETKKENIFHMIQKIINKHTFMNRISLINDFFNI